MILDVLKAQKEKASGRSLDLSKAFISSVFYIFSWGGLYQNAVLHIDEDDHLFFPFYRLVGVVAALLDHTMTVFVVGQVQVDSPVHLVFQFLKPALTFRPSRTLVPVQVKTVLNDTGWFPDSQGQVQHTAVLCLKSGVECGAKHCNGLRFQDTFVHDISPPKGRIYG